MAKGSNNSMTGRRSRGAKPYDANNSFVKKVATKVTDFIPQRSWISKWFNTSQDNGDMMNDTDDLEDLEPEEEVPQPPPLKRPRIRMDVTHPPGTFTIHPRSRTSLDEVDPRNQQYPIHNETADDFLEPPVAGPSGIRRLVASTPAVQTEIRNTSSQRDRAVLTSLAQNNGVANGTDDNSESSESTSGCSSLIPQVNRQEAPSNITYNQTFANRKRFIDDKLNFTSHLQSPRSLFLDNSPRDSLSSRRPSFNASVMNNTLDRGPTLSSPFYSGNITFGGANAAGFQRRGRTLFNNTNELQLKVPRRTSVQVKPSTTTGTDSSGMSQTAKRILEALEHFSSPVLDAKKIPIINASNGSPMGSQKRQREESGPPAARVGLRHLTRELTVPTVPDLLKLRRRQKLQDTTVAARKIVSARSVPPPTPQEYRLRSEEDEKSKYSGKVKAKAKTDLDEEETVETLNLPNIALPITSLPNFDIALPIATSSMSRSTFKEDFYKFASPIKVTDSSKNLKSINNFTFSKPINANDKELTNYCLSKTLTLESDASNMSCTSTTMSNFMWSGSSTAPKLKEKPKETESVKVACELKTGSVMDVLGKQSDPLMDAWKPAAGMWECDQCLIRNSADANQCVACKACKPTPATNKIPEISSTPSSTTTSLTKPVVNDCFGSQFKMGNNQWECTSCLVRNKQTDFKCVSCTTPKPGGSKPLAALLATSTPQPVTSDLMEKFKPAEGSWECPGCMLRNPGRITTCPCCNASKPGSLKISPKKAAAMPGSSVSSSDFKPLPATSTSITSQPIKSDLLDKFKPAAGSWECSGCMVRNADSTVTCPCCNTSKSGAVESSPEKAESIIVSGFGDKFKKPEGAWTCNDCKICNRGDVTECVACTGLKPGVKKPVTPKSFDSNLRCQGLLPDPGHFKFGIDKAYEKTVVPAGGFTFGAKSETVATGGFTFGIPKKDDKDTTETPNPTGFTFGIQKTEENKTGFKFEAKETTPVKTETKKRPLDEGETKTAPSFSFEVPKKDDPKPTAEKQFAFGAPVTTNSDTPSFSFGTPKSDAGGTEIKKEIPKITFGVPTSETPKTSLPMSKSASNTAENNGGSIPAATIKSSNTIEVKLPTVGFSFNAPNPTLNSTPATTTATASTPPVFNFGSSKTISAPQASPVSSFGQTPTPQASAASSFGQTTAPIAASKSMFVFGEKKPAETTVGPPGKKSALSFGGSTVTPAFSAPSSTPLFGSNDNKAVPAFRANENKTPMFGMPENKVSSFGNAEVKTPLFGAAENKLPAFGNTDKPAPPYNASTPTFGTPSTTPAFGSSGTPAFGSSSTSAFGASSTSNMFTASKPSANAAPSGSSLFTFGLNSTQTTPQSTGSFNFSGSNPPASTAPPAAQKSLFTFGNSSNAPQPGNGFGASTFNAPAPDPATPATANFTFNSPKPEVPAFGQTAPATTPMFGASQATSAFGKSQPSSAFSSTAPTTTPGFSFGATTPAATPGGFNFGGTAPSPAPPGGFNFNASSPAPPVAFDPNTRPTFNFTGGSAPTSFNATPQAAPQRKFKKAVRRTTQPR